MRDTAASDAWQFAGSGPPGVPPGGSPPGWIGGPPGGGDPGGSGYGPPPVFYGPGGGRPPGGSGPPPGGFGPPDAPPGPVTPQFHPLAITSMVLGILAIPTCCCGVLGGPLAIAALVTGILAMMKIRNQPGVYKGNGMAVAGIVTAGIGILLAFAAFFTTFDDALRTRYIGSFF